MLGNPKSPSYTVVVRWPYGVDWERLAQRGVYVDTDLVKRLALGVATTDKAVHFGLAYWNLRFEKCTKCKNALDVAKKMANAVLEESAKYRQLLSGKSPGDVFETFLSVVFVTASYITALARAHGFTPIVHEGVHMGFYYTVVGSEEGLDEAVWATHKAIEKTVRMKKIW